jgi:hypothetical protein
METPRSSQKHFEEFIKESEKRMERFGLPYRKKKGKSESVYLREIAGQLTRHLMEHKELR